MGMNEAEISQEISTIKERNKKVEADKAWELSWTRRLFITAGIYVLAGFERMVLNKNK